LVVAVTSLTSDPPGRTKHDALDLIVGLIYPYWHRAKTARDRLSAADLTLLERHI
jgi:hypothetical protein